MIATARRDLVVAGGSAGAIGPLTALLEDLPQGFAASVLVVIHVSRSDGALPAVLGRHARMEVRFARDGEMLVPGAVLIAPPDRHLIVDDGGVAVSAGPRENGNRPAIDALFRSAAIAAGPPGGRRRPLRGARRRIRGPQGGEAARAATPRR